MKNMRKLNKKGFTLVELLAVVVILALVMGIAATSMLSTMNSSRKNTLHSAAQTAATNLNNWIADDMLATTTSDQKLGNDFIKATLLSIHVFNSNSFSPRFVYGRLTDFTLPSLKRAIGSESMLLKVSLLLVCILRTLVPL